MSTEKVKRAPKTTKASAKDKADKAPKKLTAADRPLKAKRSPLEFDYAEVERLAGLGMTQEKIAQALGCCERTVSNRLNNDAAFAAAYARGRLSREEFVASRLQDRIEEGDTTAMKFYLSCQCGWREASKVDATVNAKVDVSGSLDLRAMSDAELMRLAGQTPDHSGA